MRLSCGVRKESNWEGEKSGLLGDEKEGRRGPFGEGKGALEWNEAFYSSPVEEWPRMQMMPKSQRRENSRGNEKELKMGLYSFSPLPTPNPRVQPP